MAGDLRAPRAYGPASRSDARPVPLPSTPAEYDASTQYSMVQPVMMTVGMLGGLIFIVINPSPLFIFAGGIFVLAAAGSAVAMAVSVRRRGSRQIAAARQRFVVSMMATRDELADRARRQHGTAWAVHPAPSALSAIPTGFRLFERRRDDSDFLELRFGFGLVAAAAAPAVSTRVDRPDPASAMLATELVTGAAVLAGMPVTVELARRRVVVVDGNGTRAAGLLRAMLLQAVTWHSPADLRLLVASDAATASEWRWIRWLPHCTELDRRVHDGAHLLVRLTPEILAREADSSEPPGARIHRRAHLLVVIDGVVPDPDSAFGLLAQPEIADITVILLARTATSPRPRWTEYTLTVADDGSVTGDDAATDDAATADAATADAASERLCESVARRIARGADLATVALSAEDVDAAPRTLQSLLGIDDLRTADRDLLWHPVAPAALLCTPVGVTADGAVVRLDFKESAAGGIGPHGLIVGATGSGKSEMLRTIVTGLALSHPPEQLSFVLADFKGGAAFAGLSELPHVAGLITNLAGDEAMVERMYQALHGEQGRRQQMLSSAGSLSSIGEYQQWARGRDGAAHMPHLMVIVDEFTELLMARPDFAELFAGIGRLGRSLGIHLILASQRLDEGRLRGLESHISYRIALRTFSAQDSSAVIGVADAYRLPSEPGWAYLKAGTTVFQRFRAAHVSAPLDSAIDSQPAPPSRSGITVLSVSPAPSADTTEPIRASDTLDTAVPSPAPADPPDPTKAWEAAVELLRAEDRRTHQVWLPPLPGYVELGALLPPLHADAVRGLTPIDWAATGTLAVPVAVIDLPRLQRYEVMLLDLAGDKGSVLVVGAPQTGKTTFVRTLALSLALTHTPQEATLYLLDFGGGLRDVEALPHVGIVVPRSDTERIERTLSQLLGIVTTRELEFARHGITSMTQARAARAAHGLPDGMSCPDVFLVVDTIMDLRAIGSDDLEAALLQLANRGLAVGVHVIVVANRPGDVRAALRDALACRVEMRLNEPADSLVDRSTARTLPGQIPGRIVAGVGLHAQVALPVLAIDPQQPPAGLREIADRYREHWRGPLADPVLVLPATVSAGDLPAPPGDQVPGVPIGFGEPDLAPVYLDVTGYDQHVLIFGDSESGKTNVLRLLMTGLAQRTRTDQARLYVVDYRRSLLGTLDDDRVAHYAGAGGAVVDMVASLGEILDGRLPGADLTATQLRSRSWWSGPELFVIVDDYDLVDTATGNPLAALADYLPQAQDIGLHLVVARRTSGASRALFTPLIQRTRDFGGCALLLSGDPGEGPLVGGVRATLQPPGRGLLIRRRSPLQRVQTALIPPDGGDSAEPDAMTTPRTMTPTQGRVHHE